jgi:DNA-binding transcriptional LysR family regulator
MFVRQLTYLVTLAREKHFARAAEKCNVTQSTLSAGLKALERELDMRLVIREPRFMGLTPEGERVVEWAAQIIIDYESLKQDVEGLRDGLKGTLRLGVIPAAIPALARLTAAFSAKHPHVSVDVNSMTSVEIQSGLDKFELDAGLTYLDNEPLVNVRKCRLYEEKYVFVTSAHGPFAKLPSITWQDASNENLCLLNESMQNRRVLNNIARSAGLKLAPTVTTNSFLAVCSYVCSGVWSSIVPHTFSHLFSECKDLVSIDLVDPIHSQNIGLVTSDRNPMPPLAHALLQCAKRLDFEDALLAAS